VSFDFTPIVHTQGCVGSDTRFNVRMCESVPNPGNLLRPHLWRSV